MSGFDNEVAAPPKDLIEDFNARSSLATLREVNLQAALDMARARIAIVPARAIKGETGHWQKPPAFRDWQNLASTDPALIEKWWTEFPEAIPGIVLGKLDMVVIDADRHSHDGVTAIARLFADNEEKSVHPVTLSAGGGEHHFFRQPAGMTFGNSEGRLPKGINMRGHGGLIIAPGAVRPDGAIWKSAPGAPSLSLAFRTRAIPELPRWLADIIRAEPDRVISPGATLPNSSSWDREKAYALAALKSCISETEQARRGERNNKLNAVAYRLGRMVVRGWLVSHDVVVQLTTACEQNRLIADDGAKAVQDTIESGLRAGMAHPLGDLPEIAKAVSSPTLIPVIWDGEAPLRTTQWLVHDLVPMGSSGLMVGESRAGKTFSAIDLARALAQGKTFCTKRARPGGTLYVAAEAPGTISGRLRAARLGPLEPFLDDHGRDKSTGKEPSPLCITMMEGTPNLLTDEGRAQLVATCRDVSEKMQARFWNSAPPRHCRHHVGGIRDTGLEQSGRNPPSHEIALSHRRRNRDGRARHSPPWQGYQ